MKTNGLVCYVLSEDHEYMEVSYTFILAGIPSGINSVFNVFKHGEEMGQLKLMEMIMTSKNLSSNVKIILRNQAG